MSRCNLSYFECNNFFCGTLFSGGGGTPDFKLQSCANADKNQPSPLKKKIHRVSNKKQKITAQKLTPPKKSHAEYQWKPSRHQHSRHPRTSSVSSIKLWRMTTSDCFEYARKSPRKSKFSWQNNTGNENFKPKKILRSSPSNEIRITPLGPSYLSR